jgi:hypothetical protein
MPRRAACTVNCLVFIAALTASCGAARRFLPMPDLDGIKSKLEYFEMHRDELDAVFIGSSRTRHGVMPLVFDTVMAEAGRPVRTLNLGVNGMVPPEELWMVRRVLALKSRPLKWIFVEMAGYRATGDTSTMRKVHWRDLTETSRLARANWRLACAQKNKPLDVPAQWGKSWKRRVKQLPPAVVALVRFTENFAPQLTALFRNEAGLGFAVYREEPDDGPDEIIPPIGQSRGYQPCADTLTKPEALDKFRKALATASRPGGQKDNAFAEQAYHEVFAQVRAAGVTPVCYVTPALRGVDFFAPQPAGETVFAFNDPGKFPDFYRPAWRIDTDHLNDAGAEAFTRLLAARFAEQLRLQDLAACGGRP